MKPLSVNKSRKKTGRVRCHCVNAVILEIITLINAKELTQKVTFNQILIILTCHTC